jgi:SAM-dependent methyltransferase
VSSGYDTYGFVADLYDHVLPYRARQDVAFFVDLARESGGPVLEVGCGTGRVLIPTARAGIEIVGLDYSPPMMNICRERLRQEPADVQGRATLVDGDMRAFDLDRAFPLVTTPFRPFQHLLTVEEQLACLASIRRHLTEEGRLVLDLFNPSIDALANEPIGEEIHHEPEFEMPDGRRIRRCHKIVACDRARQVNEVELIYDITHPDEREERLVHAFPFRYLFKFEAEHLLARAGFEVEQLYADYDKRPHGSKDPGELIFVARKIRTSDASQLRWSMQRP